MLGIALRDTGLALADLRTLARGADDAGYSTIWIPELASRDALMTAAMVGCSTKSARVATGIVPVFSRNPVALALAAATAAEACEGRFVLGLGTGHRSSAEAWFGGWQHPRRRLRETIDVVRRILAGERVSHDGEVHVDGFHLASSPVQVPIVVGALSPRSLRLAGEMADGVLLEWMTPEGLERSALLTREAAADTGRTVTVSAYVRVAVADTEDERHDALAALRDEVYLYASLPAYARSLRLHGHVRAVDRLHDGDESALDELVDTLCVWGDADAVRSRIAELQRTGLDEIVVHPVPFGDSPAETVLRAIRVLSARVATVPAVSARPPRRVARRRS